MYRRRLQQHLGRKKAFCVFGARGVGKTTLLREFGAAFSNVIYLDLETDEDREVFNGSLPQEDILKAISFLKGKEIRGSGTLILLDELGACPGAVAWMASQALLREGTPVLAATSSFINDELGMLTEGSASRVDPFFLQPFSFEEFLMAIDDQDVIGAFREVPIPYYAYSKLLDYFHLYSLIGGMPAIIADYAMRRQLGGLKKTYEKTESQMLGTLHRIRGGARNFQLAAEVFQNAYPFAATRIRRNRFSNLAWGSREIGRAFRILTEAFLVRMIPPVTSAGLPLTPDLTRYPRLQMVDTGLVNYFSGIQKPLFRSHDMNAIFEGQIARQAVGQEILATEPRTTAGTSPQAFPAPAGQPSISFWVRDKNQSTAEVDFVLPYGDMLIPVVVKSGEPGRLRSLHQFIDDAPHPFAVRLYAGKLGIQQSHTIGGKRFFLLNLPYFLAGKIREHLHGFIRLAEDGSRDTGR